jgi:2-polyprenyl-3-methyl-5-hydroxy-6-metoxy-1,4-benzoquinol methylase
MNKNDTCLICNSAKIEKLDIYYETKGLLKCKDCGFVFMERIPTDKELQEYYKKYDYSNDSALSISTIHSYNKLLDEFETYRKTNNILDVGCGRGWFLLEAKKRGWNVFGSEYADEAIELGRKKGLNMHQGPLEISAFPLKNFDVITSFEVIEHINNPQQELGYINSFLRNGGLFYCTTPNFDSIMRYYLKSDYNVICYPEHLSYYTKKTLKKIAEDTGFVSLKTLTTGISISRLKNSKNKKTEGKARTNSDDEAIRNSISKKWYLRLIKSLVNGFLNMFNLGISLKGYFIKK